MKNKKKTEFDLISVISEHNIGTGVSSRDTLCVCVNYVLNLYTPVHSCTGLHARRKRHGRINTRRWPLCRWRNPKATTAGRFRVFNIQHDNSSTARLQRY